VWKNSSCKNHPVLVLAFYGEKSTFFLIIMYAPSVALKILKLPAMLRCRAGAGRPGSLYAYIGTSGYITNLSHAGFGIHVCFHTLFFLLRLYLTLDPEIYIKKD
jgi:hypothetical protein